MNFAVVLLEVMAVDQHLPGQDAVLEGVHFGGGATLGRFGSGGFAGIAPVGVDLRRGRRFARALRLAGDAGVDRSGWGDGDGC